MFVGRKDELERLSELRKKDSASLVVITGRRRIGKSRLVQEFGKSFKNYSEFSGLPPEDGIGAQQQQDEFSRQFSDQFKLPKFATNDWGDLLRALASQTENGAQLVLLDEISWIASKDKLFLAKLKTAWDLYFKKNPKLILVLCGSISSWIERNILSSTGFLGRVSLKLVVKELSLSESDSFWAHKKKLISSYEKLKILSVTGGVPRYLEEIQANLSAEENIARLCFRDGALLLDEFERIFSDLFTKKASICKEITEFLAQGSKTYNEICKGLKLSKGGSVSQYIEELVSAGFVQRDYCWSLSIGRNTKLSKFRLSDNYLRFYLKYIKSNKEQILANRFPNRSISHLPAWESVLGLQFENLVLNNRDVLLRTMNIASIDVVNDGPYFQTQTAKRRGSQIDYMIQDRFNTLYICEIKFTKGTIDSKIIEEVSAKLDNLVVPKNFSKRPVLIHEGEVSESVVESRFFDHIIDFDSFFIER